MFTISGNESTPQRLQMNIKQKIKQDPHITYFVFYLLQRYSRVTKSEQKKGFYWGGMCALNVRVFLLSFLHMLVKNVTIKSGPFLSTSLVPKLHCEITLGKMTSSCHHSKT